jgi:hypothetical protein
VLLCSRNTSETQSKLILNYTSVEFVFMGVMRHMQATVSYSSRKRRNVHGTGAEGQNT